MVIRVPTLVRLRVVLVFVFPILNWTWVRRLVSRVPRLVSRVPPLVKDSFQVLLVAHTQSQLQLEYVDGKNVRGNKTDPRAL